jgi:hypothetical protein
MSKNIHQIYVANPITSNASTDLMYFGQSPYGVGNDAAETFANFAAQFAPPQGLKPVAAASTPITAAINTMYYITDPSTVTITLPVTAPAGSVISIVGYGAGGWILAPGAGQSIGFPTGSATASVASSSAADSIEVVCVVANTTWTVRTSSTTEFVYS